MRTFTKEQTEEALRKSPQAIHDLIIFGTISDVVIDVTTKHNLHVDVTGNVIDIATNLVIGLLTPEQFVSELKSVNVPDNVTTDIAKALNDRVFGPMRKAQEEALKKPTSSQPSQQKTAPVSVSIQKPTIPPPQQPKPTVPQNAPRPAPATKAQEQGGAVPQTPRPMQPSVPQTPPAPKPFSLPTQTRPVPPARPVVHTMMKDAQHVSDAPTKLIPPTPTQPSTPVQTPKPTTSPMSAPPPIQAPIQPPRTEVAPPTSEPQKPKTPVPTINTASEPVKKYGTDPYREPIE